MGYRFKYYRRGTGELDTSNFPDLAKQKRIEVHHLDSRTLMSLAMFQKYLEDNHFDLWYDRKEIKVIVDGYVPHMRADKDLFDPSFAYASLGFTFDVRRVQHDSRNGIVTAKIDKDMLLSFDMLNRKTSYFTRFVGADSSVHKFFPDVDVESQKIRENGKVVSLDLDLGDVSHLKQVVIVDDILGGGATVKMCVDRIRESGYTGPIFLWTEWNEGIHTPEFLDLFVGYYIGENIFNVN